MHKDSSRLLGHTSISPRHNYIWMDEGLIQITVRKHAEYCNAFKGLIHPKMKIKSLITHPHAVPTP